MHWPGFRQAQGWELMSTPYSNNQTQIHIFKMYLKQQHIEQSSLYLFKTINLLPLPKAASYHSISINLKNKQINQIRSQIIALERLKPYTSIVQLYEILIESQVQQDLSSFYHSYFKQSNTRKMSLILEYGEKGSLEQHLYKNTLCEAQIVVCLLDILEGIKAMQQCQIIHRDLCTANIILAQDGFKIIDFDNCFIKNISGAEQLQLSFRAHVSAPQIKQLLDLSKQERQQYSQVQLFNKQNKCDIYSFGTLIHEVLFKKQFQRQLYIQDIYNYKESSSFKQFLVDIMVDCLKQDPDQRSSMVQLQRKLLQLAERSKVKYTREKTRKCINKVSYNLQSLQYRQVSSSKSIEQSISASDWSLDSTSLKQIITNKHLPAKMTITSQNSKHRTLAQ